MKQIYHPNTITNVHIRKQIKKEPILKENYANIYIEHSRNREKMNEALIAFLMLLHVL